jgi:hypothetical protein
MLARDGDKKVIRVDMARPTTSLLSAADEEELGTHFEVARDMARAELALAQGDIEGAMDIFKKAAQKAKDAAQKIREAAKKAAGKAGAILHKASQPAPVQHIVVEMPQAFINDLDKEIHQQERTLKFVEELYKQVIKIKEAAEPPDSTVPDEEPAVTPADTPNPPTTERPCYYILRSTKA